MHRYIIHMIFFFDRLYNLNISRLLENRYDNILSMVLFLWKFIHLDQYLHIFNSHNIIFNAQSLIKFPGCHFIEPRKIMHIIRPLKLWCLALAGSFPRLRCYNFEQSNSFCVVWPLKDVADRKLWCLNYSSAMLYFFIQYWDMTYSTWNYFNVKSCNLLLHRNCWTWSRIYNIIEVTVRRPSFSRRRSLLFCFWYGNLYGLD